MSIQENYKRILDEIAAAQARSPHACDEVQVVVVSKHHSLDEVHEAYQAGARVFAENRVQELLTKIHDDKPVDLRWQLIGHLQTNKVRQVIDHVEMIQSLDSAGLAAEIEKRAAQRDIRMPVLLQVNVAGEDQKYGFAPDAVAPFLHDIGQYPHLQVRGLMFIGPNYTDKNDMRPHFRTMRALFTSLKAMENDQISMQWLSMGMSGDYIEAVEEGANMVRVGSAVFNTDL